MLFQCGEVEHGKSELNTDEVKTLMPVAVLHCLTHLGAIVSLGAGAVSFTHIVKAEPAVSAGLLPCSQSNFTFL